MVIEKTNLNCKGIEVCLAERQYMSECKDLIINALISLHDKKISQEKFQSELENLISILRISEFVLTAREVEKAKSHSATDDYLSERLYIKDHLETSLLFLEKEEQKSS